MTHFKRSAVLLFFFLCTLHLVSQETFPRNDVLDERSDAYAFTNATIVVDHESTITEGVLLIREGIIVELHNETENLVFDLTVSIGKFGKEN